MRVNIKFLMFLFPFALVFSGFVFFFHRDFTLEDYASQIIYKCSSSEYHPGCYDKEIPVLMDSPTNLSMEDAFKITQIVQQKDSGYKYCHDLGHNLGTKEIKKDRSKWKEVITRCPNGMCDSGCLHGSLVEAFRGGALSNDRLEELSFELEDVCRAIEGWNLTFSKQSFCFHGLGHLLMFATDADINKSIEICNLVTSKNEDNDFSRACFDGVFMQFFQLFHQLDFEDIALMKDRVPAKEQVTNFCSRYPTKERTACMIQSWPKFEAEIMEPQGLVKLCSFADDLVDPVLIRVEKARCYRKLIGTVTNRLLKPNQNVREEVRRFCSSWPVVDGEDKLCFATAAKRLVQLNIGDVKIASEICRLANSKKTADYCLNVLSKYSKKISGSAEFQGHCNSLSDPWSQICKGELDE